MGSTLEDFIAQGCTSDTSKESVNYNETGDYLAVYFSHEDTYAERIDDLLTVYNSEDTHQLVGFKIKGVARQLSRLGSLGVACDKGPISLSLLICSNLAEVDEASLHQYKLISEKSNDIRINPAECLVG